MTTKQWLEQSKYISKEIDALENEKNTAAVQAARLTRVAAEKLSKTTKSRNDAPLVKYADSEQMARIDKRLTELRIALNDISDAIYSVQDGAEKYLLINRYLLFKKWGDIALNMGCSPNYVYRIHKNALNSINKS